MVPESVFFFNLSLFKKKENLVHTSMTRSEDLDPGTSLVVQWLRTCFPMEGIWVLSLAGELRPHML